VTHEPELTSAVDLCLPDGGPLNPAARGWSRRPLHRANLDGGDPGRNKRWDYWAVLAGDVVVSCVYSDIDLLGLPDVWWAQLSSGRTGGQGIITEPGAERLYLVDEKGREIPLEKALLLLVKLVAERAEFRYSIRDLFEVRPSMSDRNGPVARSTAAAIRRVIGRDPEFICSPGTYDQKHIDRVGKLRDCIAYGPGILDLAHQPDEYVLIEDMVKSAQVMALAAWSLLHRTA